MGYWQILTIERLDDYTYWVTYLINGRSRAKALLHPTLGLDHAITAMGTFLASLPEFNRAPIGNKHPEA